MTKTLNGPHRFFLYALKQAIRHPRQRIKYIYCPECKVRLPANATECPVCHKSIGNSPEKRDESAIPWWGSILVIIVGISCWCVGASFHIEGLDEAGRALVYFPLGTLFGVTIK